MTKEKDKKYSELYETKKIEREEYWDQLNRDHAINTKRWIAETPEQKTNRSWECMGKTHYMLRNGFQEPNAQRVELIKKEILAHFQQNNIVWCPLEKYEHLLPPKKDIEKTGGWKKIGDLVQVNKNL